MNLPAEELVVGDVITVKFGDRMPADIRVIECHGFKVCRAILCFRLSLDYVRHLPAFSFIADHPDDRIT